MSLTKLTADLENIQALSDKPNEIEGLTADELKAKFDKAGSDIKTFLNDTLTAEIDALITATKLALNPIGTLVMNITGTNPSTYIGGTWTAWGTGRVPVGVDATQTEFDTVEKTGGAKTHTLSVNEIPSHRHDIRSGEEGTEVYDEYGPISTSNKNKYQMSSLYSGGGQAHNNLQPHITCYFFKRTA